MLQSKLLFITLHCPWCLLYRRWLHIFLQKNTVSAYAAHIHKNLKKKKKREGEKRKIPAYLTNSISTTICSDVCALTKSPLIVSWAYGCTTNPFSGLEFTLTQTQSTSQLHYAALNFYSCSLFFFWKGKLYIFHLSYYGHEPFLHMHISSWKYY